ncbi:CehA/McbA family metallohydrolase [Maribellus mangrovi]|uniref:CehA/McbA family metallohydrolase n=1 Tax=Maribellus mangrovi TaxID=3133146 RepID=UPI0030EE2961
MKNQTLFTFKISAILSLLIISGTVIAKTDARDGNKPMFNAAPAEAIGDYNVYYGHLHNHSNASDGTGTPDEAYNYAKNTAGLDFFSLSDHAYLINSTEWTTIKNTAENYNEDGVFATFWGFEWSHSTHGHVTVINTEDYCTTGTEPNFSDLLSWVSSRECAAFFNHPGRQNSTDEEFGQFLDTPSDKFVGMELWNKTDVFNVYYYNDGYYSQDGNLGYFDEALTQDWRIGAGGSEDNHTSNWGTRTDNRLAVLASNLTRADIYEAIKSKRFFTTLDKNLKLSFTINGQEMGSTIQGNSGQSLQILASDDDAEIFSQVQLFLNGAVLSTWTPGIPDVNISENISTSDGDYYYIKVTQNDGDEAISSPIFIEGGISNESPVCSITNPEEGEHFNLTQSIVLLANASDSDGSVSQVEFFVDGVSVGSDNTSPFEVNWTIPANGTYTITAKASDDLNAETTSEPVNITVGVFSETVSAQIASSNDDVEEGQNGAMYTTSTDLELIYDTYNDQFLQTVGLHFSDLNIPQGATITSASIQFTVDEASAGTVNLIISGDASDDSPAFTSSAYDLSNRTKTLNNVNWSPPDWNTVNEAGINQQSPDFSPVIQEIVDRPGFSVTSAISLFITGTETNKRVAVAYDGLPASAAVLTIEYTVGDDNIPPATEFSYSATYLDVDFTDESSDSDGTIVDWQWDFGDGNTSTEQNPTYTYSSPGTFTVTLTVTDDDDASNNTSQQLTVSCLDSDGDGVCDANDNQINSPCPDYVDEFGVSIDTDGDGLADCQDGCPDDASKTTPGVCGCGIPDTDSDSDGVADCMDDCPDDVNKTTAGDCGCGVADTDTDNDGLADCIDGCPDDPNKTEPGDCGCGIEDTDSDNDGIADCIDDCMAQTTNFEDNLLIHSGSGLSSTTLDLPNNSMDVSFTISGINTQLGKPANRYTELVSIIYIDENGITQSGGIYSGADVSTVEISISGYVQSVTVSLTDGDDGDSGSSTMSISFSAVDFCTGEVEPCADDDGDGVCNEVDQCPGYDDNIDTDGDGFPDGCDECPEFDNNLLGQSCNDNDPCTENDIYVDCNVCAGTFSDSDIDGICDDSDICPGYDDNVDTDDDGVPDGCDACPTDPNDACEASDYCFPENMINTGDFIKAVTIGSFSETFELGSGYQYYTERIVSLSAGTNTVELTPENSKNRNYWKIWIDSDYDGVFDDLTETVLSIPSKKGTISADITVPVITENTRMRISMRNQALPLPCDDGFEGDVKDFDISVAASTKSASVKPSTPVAEELSLKVYPNPFKNEINIQISGNGDYKKSRIHIRDIAGKLMYSEVFGQQGIIKIQDIHLSPGCYFITVQLDDWTKTEQLIKTR